MSLLGSLISLLIIVLVLWLLIWLIDMLPIPAQGKTAAKVIVILIGILYLIGYIT